MFGVRVSPATTNKAPKRKPTYSPSQFSDAFNSNYFKVIERNPELKGKHGRYSKDH